MSDICKDCLDIMKECDALRARLSEAISYLREGKAMFAPNTTNSHVDVFLARYDTEESNATDQRAASAAPLHHLVGRIIMHPQPVWEEEPRITETGAWAGRYRYCVWGYSGPEEHVGTDMHTPPSQRHRPASDDGIVWYWTTDPPNAQDNRAEGSGSSTR
jgi:hypothetical protein